MNNKQIVDRIEKLLKERHLTWNALKDNSSISTTVYQWRKNANRDATRTPSLSSIEKICGYFGISLAYFFAVDEEEELKVRQKEVGALLNKLPSDDLIVVESVIRALLKKTKDNTKE